MNHDPWNGPCVAVVASKGWKGFSRTLSIDASLDAQRVGALVSLKSEGSVRVDDVSLVLETGTAQSRSQASH